MSSPDISWRSAMAVAVASTVLTTAVALSISALFSPPVFLSWVALIAMAGVPTQIVIAGLWRHRQPACLNRLSQPFKGLAYIAITALAAGAVSIGLVFGVGNGSMPSPILVMYVILSISVAFWWIFGFGAWPLPGSRLSPVASGIVCIVTIYAMTWLLYSTFFNFHFLAGKPFYDPSLDPEGWFDAWDALILAVTSVALVLVTNLFDNWPFRGIIDGDRQPLFGLSIFALVFVLSLLFAQVAPAALDIDRIDYLVYGPVAFIFGYFIIVSLMRGQAYHSFSQPAKGAAATGSAIIIGTAMAQLYRLATPIVASQPLAAGAPFYDLELWVATAMLAVTFPVISAFAGDLEFWPLIRR